MKIAKLGGLLAAGLLFGIFMLGRFDAPLAVGSVSALEEMAILAKAHATLKSSLFLRGLLKSGDGVLGDHPFWRRFWRAPQSGGPAAAEAGPLWRTTFPHAPDGRTGGLSLRSKVILINNGGADAEGTIFVWGRDGGSRVVSTNLGRAGQFDFQLLSGEALRLETDGAGPLSEGWIEVASNVRLSGSATFTVLDSSGAVLSEVGIGDSQRTRRSMVFVDGSGGRNTGWAICNPNPELAPLSVELRNLGGDTVASKSITMGAMEQNSEFVSTTFPQVEMDGFKGVLIVDSPAASVALVTLKTRGVNFTSFPAAPQVVEGQEEEDIYFSRLGDGVFGDLVFRSAFVLMNNSDAAVAGTLRLYAADGDPLALRIGSERASQFPVQVPPLGAVELVSDGSSTPGVVGWAVFEPDGPLTGGAAFAISERDTGVFVSDTGVPSSPMTAMPAIFVQERESASTGIALSNPSDSAVTVRLKLMLNRPGGAAPAGVAADFAADLLVAETSVQLEPFSHVGLFVPQLFPAVPAIQRRDFEGRLEMEAFVSDFGEEFLTPVTGITLLARGTLLTSLPLAERMASFGPRATFTASTTLAGSAPSFCLTVRQLAGDQSLRRAVIALEKGSFDLSRAAPGRSLGKLHNKVLAFVFAGNNFCGPIDDDSVTLFHPLTYDGVNELEFFFTEISNRSAGGVQFEIWSNLPYSEILLVDYHSRLCFDAGLFRMTGDPGEIRISQRYESHSIVAGDLPGGLVSTRYDSVAATGLPAGAPRVHGVTPDRVLGGQELVVVGSGFSPAPQQNRVMLQGSAGSEQAEVLSATADSLTVRLPEVVGAGPLEVQTGGRNSNPYQLKVAFAPQLQVDFDSLHAGAASGLSLGVSQTAGEIQFWNFRLTASSGSWITDGFAAGEAIGTVTTTDPGGGGDVVNLIVRSSGPETLVVDLLEEGEDEADTTITISRTDGTLRLTTAETPICTELPASFEALIRFDRPIFRMPQSAGSPLALAVEAFSAPERAGFESTAHQVQSQRMYAVQ